MPESRGNRSFVEAPNDVLGLDSRECVRGHKETRVVVDEVQDLDVTSVREAPVRHICLPHFVRQLGTEADQRGLRSFLRLVGDEPVAAQHSPDRRHRRHASELALEVTGDRVRSGVVALAN
jgi:hypothetical protein